MRFKRGELDFYKKHSPKELEELYNDIPDRQESIMSFVDSHQYNFVKKTWKRG